MALTSAQKQFVDYAKTQTNKYNYLPDDIVFKKLQTEGLVPPELQDKIKRTPERASISQELGAGPEGPDRGLGLQQDFNFLQHSMDYWIDEDSPDWMKAAYTRSLTGSVEQLATGKSRYNVDDSDFNLLEDIGASLLSFIMPLDIITMFGGGFAGKGLSQFALKGMQKKVMREAAEKGVSETAENILGKTSKKLLSKQKIAGGIQQAPALALYEGAMGGVQAAIHGENVWGGIGYGVVHGGLIGGLTGYAGTGMGLAQSKILEKGKTSALKPMQKLKAYGVFGRPAQVLAESAIFSSADAAFRGFDVTGEEFLDNLYHDIGMFGFMKINGRVFGKAKDIVSDVRKEIAKNVDNDNVKLKKSTDNVINSLEDADINTDVIKEVRDNTDKVLINRRKELGDLEAKIEVLASKFDPNDPNKTTATRQELTEAVISLKELEGAIDYIEKNVEGDFNIAISQQSRDKIKSLKKNLIDMDQKLEKMVSERNKKKGDYDPHPDYIINQNQKIVRGLDGKESIVPYIDLDAHDLTTKAGRKKALQEIGNLQAKENEIKNAKADKIDDIDEVGILSTAKSNKKSKKASHKDNAVILADEIMPDSDLSDIGKKHKKIIIGAASGSMKASGLTGAVKQYKDLLKFVEDTYQTDISKLNSEQIASLLPSYMRDVMIKDYGVDVHNWMTDAQKEAAYKKAGKKWDAVESDKIKRIAKKIVNDLRAFETGGNPLKNYLGADVKRKIIEGYAEPNVSGRKKELIYKKDKSPREAIEEMIVHTSGQDTVTIGTGKNKRTYTGDEASLILEIMARGSLRPGEVARIWSKDVFSDRIVVRGDKNTPPAIITNPDIVRRANDYKDKKGRRGQESLFDFGDNPAKNINELVLKMIEESGAELTVKDNISGEIYRKDELIGDLNERAGKKTQAGRIFRKIYEEFLETDSGASKDIFEEASKRRHRIYKDEGGKKKLGVTKTYMVTGETGPTAYVSRLKEGQRVEHKGKEKTITSIEPIAGKEGQFNVMFEGEASPVKYLEGSADIGILKTKYQKKRIQDKIDAGIERQKQQKQWFEKIPAYKKLKIKLVKTLGKHKGEKVLGRVTGHLIEVVEGKSRKDTIPHEVSHYVVDVLSEFGTKKDKALIKKGIQMFGNKLKRKKGESLADFMERKEELLVQRIGEFATGKLENKTLIAKAKNFIKDFWVRVKDVVGIATKDDIAFMLSRRVVKGDIPISARVKNSINSNKTHYQKEGTDIVHKNIRVLEKRLRADGYTDNDLLAIREHVSPDLSSGFKVKDIDLGTMNRWYDELDTHIGRKAGNSGIRETIKAYDVPEKDVQNISYALGENAGDFRNLSPKARKQFTYLVEKYYKMTEPLRTGIDEILGSKDNKMPAIKRIARGLMPAYYVIRKYGSKKLADRILDFEVTFNKEFKGRGDLDSKLIKDLLDSKIPLQSKLDLVWMFDAKRVENIMRQAKEGDVDIVSLRKQAGLIRDKGNLDSKTGLTKRELAFWEDLKDKTTPASAAKEVHDGLMKFYWDGLYGEVSKINNKVEMKDFEKEFGQKFVKDYFSRRLTKQAYNYLITANNGKNLAKLIKGNVKDAAINVARKEGLKKFPNKGPEYNDFVLKRKKELIESETFQGEVAEDITWMLKHRHDKVVNKHLLERGPLLDEFMEITTDKGHKKVVRTYENHLSRTVEPYIMSMSQFLATVRHFPEYTGLGGKYKLGSSKMLLLQTQIKDNTIAQYSKKTIEALIGVDNQNPLLDDANKLLSVMAHTSAAVGLSSPTSGIKNLLIGIPRATASFGFWNTGVAITKLFDSRVWRAARKAGALEYGAKTLELGQTPGRVMEKLFKFNLMTTTENINRIVSMEAGKLYFANTELVLQGKKGMFGGFSKKNAKRLMFDMYKLSDEQVSFLEKGDYSTLSKEYQDILSKVEHFSHVSAQGGTSAGLLPLWASGKMGRPFTLFQRMAYATTWDTYRNYIRPIYKYKNIAPLARAAAAHTVSGAGMYMMYRWLFEQEPPESSGDKADQVLNKLWRSEFFGLAGEIFSPYDRGLIQSLAEPVIVRNSKELYKSFYSWTSGRDNWASAGNAFLKKTIVAYGQYDTMKKNITSEQYSNAKKINNWKRQFKKDYDIAIGNFEINDKKSVYYRDLKEALVLGSERDIVKTFFAAYNYLIIDLEKIPGTTKKGRHKEALSRLKKSLKSMNPLNISKETRHGRLISQRTLFLSWLETKLGKTERNLAIKGERQYQFSMRQLDKILSKKKHWQEWSVYFDERYY